MQQLRSGKASSLDGELTGNAGQASDALKALIVSTSDAGGGAARASVRLGTALRSEGIDVEMLVSARKSDLPWVNGSKMFRAAFSATARSYVGTLLLRCQKSPDRNLRSLEVLPSAIPKRLNQSNFDVVNLHWVCAEMLSIRDIAKIEKPIVWTLHDMWPFAGAEHYAPDDPGARWRTGYTRHNRPAGSTGIDLDAWTWNRKRSAWREPLEIVAPTEWLATCARESMLMRDWPVRVIPNALDTSVFRPWPKSTAREMLGLPKEVPLLAFGALGGTSDPRKGWDLLERALPQIAKSVPETEAVIFGQSAPSKRLEIGMNAHWMGHLSDDLTLALLYSAVDTMVVPSRQDNLPQSATEAQSCGCPVVAFNTGGLADAVSHQVTGYLAEPFEADDLAEGVVWLLSDAERHDQVSAAARQRAVTNWSPSVVAKLYGDAFKSVVG